jgi:MFS family permease
MESYKSKTCPSSEPTASWVWVNAKVKRMSGDSTVLRRVFRELRTTRIVTVEPLVFLFMFGLFLMIFTQQQYFFWHYGKLFLNSTHDDCISAEDLESDAVVKVQKSASHLLSYVNFPGQLLCIATSMVLGPLSDTMGRRFIFYLVGIGVVMQGVLSLVVVVLNLDLHIFIVGGVLSGMSGGFAATLGACFAYAADISSPGPSRSIRIAVIEAMVFVAGLIAEGGAGYVLEQLKCSFWPLIAVYIGSGVLMILYTALFLREPFSRSERLQRAADSPKGIGRLLRGLRLFFCPSTYSTWKLWAALGALTIIVGNLVGAQMITAIFQEGPPLKWKPAMIGYFDVVQMAAHGFATLVILPLLVALSLPDVATALIGVVFNAAVGVLTGFVHQSWQMFLIGTVSGMESMVAPSARSLMSKLVSAGDQGAMFSFTLSVELVAAAAATAFYPNIFPVILSSNLRPGSAYFIMAALCIIPLFLLCLIWAATYRSHTWLCCKEISKRKLESLPPAPSPGTDDEGEEPEEFEPLLYRKDHLHQSHKKGQYTVN